MNLLNSNGNKTLAPSRNIKERLLEEQIFNLRSVHQDSFQVFDKIVATLKKMISYRNMRKDEERDQIAIQNIFLEELGNIEESLLDISGELQTDHELYTSTLTFRNAEKNIENQNFKLMMKGYEEFKQNMNQKIHHLQKDIQILEKNGFHVYTQVQKHNNVLNSLKKSSLQRFLSMNGELETITELLKKKMNIESQDLKRNKYNRTILPYFKNKLQQFIKILKNVEWKQIAHRQMMMKEMEKIKSQIQREDKKGKITDKATKEVDQKIKLTDIEIYILKGCSNLEKKQVKKYFNHLKESVDKHYVLTSNIFNKKKNRSKSCHTIMTRSHCKKIQKKKERENDESNILGCDFLESSIEM